MPTAIESKEVLYKDTWQLHQAHLFDRIIFLIPPLINAHTIRHRVSWSLNPTPLRCRAKWGELTSMDQIPLFF